jgi:hypothetical protein
MQARSPTRCSRSSPIPRGAPPWGGPGARVDAVFDIRHHVRAMETLFDEVLARRQGTT